MELLKQESDFNLFWKAAESKFQLVRENRENRKWSEVAKHLGSRSGKQCRERYNALIRFSFFLSSSHFHCKNQNLFSFFLLVKKTTTKLVRFKTITHDDDDDVCISIIGGTIT